MAKIKRKTDKEKIDFLVSQGQTLTSIHKRTGIPFSTVQAVAAGTNKQFRIARHRDALDVLYEAHASA